ENAVAQAPVRYSTKPFLDELHGRAFVQDALEIELHGIEAREPADRSRHVERPYPFFSSVSFDVDSVGLTARPGAERKRQGGEQDVVDLRAVRRRDLLEQRSGLVAIQGHRRRTRR